MSALAFYNDVDPGSCEWTRQLIVAGQVPPGTVDERSIHDVQASDLKGFAQVHLFCGVSGWALALQLAGWPEGRECWTGSCPCQSYSNAGRRQGDSDARNLWPEMRRLVREARPGCVFGEQVASADGREWLSRVRRDLEHLGYAVGAADLCASGVGGPHQRQRLFWGASLRREGSVEKVMAPLVQQGLFG